METAMRFECASFLGKFLIVTALSVASLAYSQQSLPGCEPAPEVRKALNEELNGKQLEKMPFADRVARRRDIYEKLIVNNPREVEPYRGLIEYTRRMQEYLDPTPMSALQERFRKQAALHPDDPLALYVAGVALFGADTPDSLLRAVSRFDGGNGTATACQEQQRSRNQRSTSVTCTSGKRDRPRTHRKL